MKHKTLHMFGLVALGIALVLGGWYVYANTLGRPLLVGETDHDFGVVWLEGADTKVNHTFRLANNSNDIIFVKDIKSTCKCTVPEMEDRRVMPGTDLELNAELTIRKSGKQRTAISLLLGDGRVQQLYVEALGRRKMPLTYIGAYVELLYNLPKNLAINCEIYNAKDEPPPLSVRTPHGVTANFKRWKLKEFYDEEWQNPAIYEAELILTRTTPDDLPKDATIDVSIDDENWYSVPINRPDLVKTITYDTVPGADK